MVARTGAIDRFWLEDGKLNYNVIGGNKPEDMWIGLIGPAPYFLETGVLDETGLINTERYCGAWHDTDRGCGIDNCRWFRDRFGDSR